MITNPTAKGVVDRDSFCASVLRAVAPSRLNSVGMMAHCTIAKLLDKIADIDVESTCWRRDPSSLDQRLLGLVAPSTDGNGGPDSDQKCTYRQADNDGTGP
jgi:hypothetical protein